MSMAKQAPFKKNLQRIYFLLNALNLASDFTIKIEREIPNIIPFSCIEPIIECVGESIVEALFFDGEVLELRLEDEGKPFTFVNEDQVVVQRTKTSRSIELICFVEEGDERNLFDVLDCWDDVEGECIWMHKIYPEIGKLECYG